MAEPLFDPDPRLPGENACRSDLSGNCQRPSEPIKPSPGNPLQRFDSVENLIGEAFRRSGLRLITIGRDEGLGIEKAHALI